MLGSKSVMDVLNLWKDDPEELLLDLGFGRDEPDLSGRIPARFISYQSQARGVNLQVFLEAQKNRLDLENPDVSNRFRELEVLQHVTTTLCSLVVSSSSSSVRAPLNKQLSPQARERRRHIGLLFRRASKKSLCQTHNHKTQEISPSTPTSAQNTVPETLLPPPSPGEKEVPLERVGPGPLENEEAVLNPQMVSSNIQERALKPEPPVLEREESPDQADALIEMDEVSVEKYSLSSPCPDPEPPCSETEMPPEQDWFPPAPSSRLEYLDPRSSSPELRHITPSQSTAAASSVPADAEDDAPYLSTLPQDREATASPPFTTVPPSPSQNSSLSAVQDVIYTMTDQLPLDSRQRGSKGDGTRDSIKANVSDLAFETCVDGVEGETVDVEAFLQQLEAEGRVYWAEPVQVWDPADESSSSEASLSLPSLSSAATGAEQASVQTTASSDSAPSLSAAPLASLPANSDLKPSSRSVSVQMPSSLSSHIVQRKDVPYVEASERPSPPPGVFTVDTSSPFRAVQEWTDAQIQRNVHKSSRQADSPEATETAKASQTTQRSTLTFSQSSDISPGTIKVSRTVSGSGGVSGLEEGAWDGNTPKENLWEGDQSVTMSCCCSCDHHCTCHKQHDPFSLGDLEEMMLCLQHFRSVHGSVEEQLSEDQASVYGALSDQDREKIQDVEVLRRAVEQEAAELETHLNQFAHLYDDSLKVKMQRLLDEQSLLCSQLFLPGAGRPASGLRPKRTVSVQCRLLPWTSAEAESDHVSSWSTWSENSPRRSPCGSESSCKDLRCFSESQFSSSTNMNETNVHSCICKK